MDFVFKHPESGEVKTVTIPDATIRLEMEEDARDLLTCDCEPIGETNVVECNCCDYYDEFELVFTK